jgi:precorrin-6B methylase 2
MITLPESNARSSSAATLRVSVEPESPAPTPENIFRVGSGFWSSKTLLSAVELDVFTHLARHPGTVDELRARIGLHPRSARDFLDALVALGFLDRDPNGVYRNTTESDLFLDKAKPSYIGGLLEMANARLYGFWNNLTEGLRTGRPQNEAKTGGDLFGQIYGTPERLKLFLEAMSGVSRGANLAIAANFPWHKYRTFVDAGTAQGDLAVQVARANPHLHGIGFDLPQVAPIFEAYATNRGVADRVRFRGGDFFQQPLPKADVVMMGHILHDWDLAQKKHLIQAAWDALPAGGAFIAYDAVIDDERRSNAFGLLMSLNMLIETPGGFDYTGADCMGWLKEAGFRETYVQHLVGPDSMVVGIK